MNDITAVGDFSHQTVLLAETVASVLDTPLSSLSQLAPKFAGIFVDATFGRAVTVGYYLII